MIFGLNGVGIATASQITGKLADRISEVKLFFDELHGLFWINYITGTTSISSELYLILIPLLIAISSIGVVGTTGNSLALQSQGKIAGSASALLGLQFSFPESLHHLQD